MNRKGFALPMVFASVVVALIAGSLWYYSLHEEYNTPAASPSSMVSSYHDDRITVSGAEGWTYAPAATDTAGNAIGLTFTKNDYTLSLLSHSGQVSGIQGGRLDEISGIALSLPVGPYATGCSAFIFVTATTTINDLVQRVDIYFDADHATNEEKTECYYSGGHGLIWYGSYFTQGRGYFLDYPSLAGITYPFGGIGGEMAFGIKLDKVSSSSDLPVKGDAGLVAALDGATAIVKNIVYNKVIAVPDLYTQLMPLSNYSGWVGTEGDSNTLLTCDSATGRTFSGIIDMESLTDVAALYGKVADIATANGWQKCNTSKNSLKTTDAYQKGDVLMNVQLDNGGTYIDVLFANKTGAEGVW